MRAPNKFVGHCLLLLLGGLLLQSEVWAASPAQNTVSIDPPTEEIIKGGLRYLAGQQDAAGAFIGESAMERNYPIAMSSYVLMAFQAAGNLPGEGEFGKVVSHGVQYLLDAVQPDGLLPNRYDEKYMYEHGIATICLAELYGSTRSATIRTKLEQLINIILTSQNESPHDSSRFGGWRYQPVPNDADVSATAIQVVALRAARNAGLHIPQAALDNAVIYIKRCYDARSGGFLYRLEDRGRGPNYARTAAAIYSLQVCGLYDDPMVKSGAAFLREHRNDRDWYAYGNNYSAPALYMVGGEAWKEYYTYTKAFLVPQVQRRGNQCYWLNDFDNQNRGRGALYGTAIFTYLLAMPYHYIPLYQR